MDTRERIKKMFEKTEPILQAGRKDKPEQLKPCPFCGADIENGVHIDVVVSFNELKDDTHYGVICENCGARIGSVFSNIFFILSLVSILAPRFL